jgi:hypothetical protein
MGVYFLGVFRTGPGVRCVARPRGEERYLDQTLVERAHDIRCSGPFDRSPVESGDDMRELYDLILQIESTGEILSIPRTPAASESSNDCSCQKTEVCPESLNHLS